MGDYIRRGSLLFDPTSKQQVGFVDLSGQEVLGSSVPGDGKSWIASWPRKIPYLLPAATRVAVTGAAVGATTNAAGYAIGVATVTLAAAGIGSIPVNSIVQFPGDLTIYRVSSGDADVSNGGSITFAPPLVKAIPTVATAINVIPALSAGGAATVIGGAVTVPARRSGAHTYFGPPTQAIGSEALVIGAGTASGITSTGAIEESITTSEANGRIEVLIYGTTTLPNNGIRVGVKQLDGNWGYLTPGPTFFPAVNDGQQYRGMLTLGAPGTYELLFECSSNTHFGGVACLPSDTVRGAAAGRKRIAAIMDSYGVNVSDANPYQFGSSAWATQAGYYIGAEVIVISAGGCGYEANAANAGPRAYEHLPTTLAALGPSTLYEVWSVLGLNDCLTGKATAVVQSAAARAFAIIKGMTGKPPRVFSPEVTKTLGSASVLYALDHRDAIRTEAFAVGSKFLDSMSLPLPAIVDATFTTTLSVGLNAGNTTMTIPLAPYPYSIGGTGAGRNGWWGYWKNPNGQLSEVREILTMDTGSPRNITYAALTNAQPAGTVFSICGAQDMTGNGRQDAKVGNGNADFNLGPDAVHLTNDGHLAKVRTAVNLISYSEQS